MRASYEIIISARRQGYILSAVEVYEKASTKGPVAALENRAYADEATDEQLFAHSQTVANPLCKLNKVIQSIA